MTCIHGICPSVIDVITVLYSFLFQKIGFEFKLIVYWVQIQAADTKTYREFYIFTKQVILLFFNGF